jgi:perosamine synthetase
MEALTFPTWPQLEPDDIEAVVETLKSSQLSQLSSSSVEDFEKAFADLHDRKHCIAVNSGTSAIHAALVAMDIKAGDEVIVPSHTFIGSASPILYQHASPVFADVDDKTYCVSTECLKDVITERTKAIIAVHLNGQPAPIDEIVEYANRRGIAVIEDVAQALGARLRGTRVGAFGHVACFSFWEDKIITTGGEGGAILTDDEKIALRIRRLRHHGEKLSQDTRLYSSVELGYNYRLTAMQAALGLSQLTRLESYIKARRSNALRLTEGLRDLTGLQIPCEVDGCIHAFWKYVCRLHGHSSQGEVESVVQELRMAGIPAYRRYPIPLHRQPVFAASGHKQQKCVVADQLSGELFSLPVHPALSTSHIEFMIEKVRAVVEAHTART